MAAATCPSSTAGLSRPATAPTLPPPCLTRAGRTRIGTKSRASQWVRPRGAATQGLWQPPHAAPLLPHPRCRSYVEPTNNNTVTTTDITTNYVQYRSTLKFVDSTTGAPITLPVVVLRFTAYKDSTGNYFDTFFFDTAGMTGALHHACAFRSVG